MLSPISSKQVVVHKSIPTFPHKVQILMAILPEFFSVFKLINGSTTASLSTTSNLGTLAISNTLAAILNTTIAVAEWSVSGACLRHLFSVYIDDEPVVQVSTGSTVHICGCADLHHTLRHHVYFVLKYYDGLMEEFPITPVQTRSCSNTNISCILHEANKLLQVQSRWMAG